MNFEQSSKIPFLDILYFDSPSIMHFFQIGMKSLLYIYWYKVEPHLSLSVKPWGRNTPFLYFFHRDIYNVTGSGWTFGPVSLSCERMMHEGGCVRKRRWNKLWLFVTLTKQHSHGYVGGCICILHSFLCLSEISISIQCIHFLLNLVRGNFLFCIINPAWCSTSLIKFRTAPFSFLHIQHCSLIFCFLSPACFF